MLPEMEAIRSAGSSDCPHFAHGTPLTPHLE